MFSNLFAGFLPLWLYTLGQEFLQENDNISVPFLNIFTTLLYLIIPLLVGLFIKVKLPKVKRVVLKIITPFTVIAIVLLLTVGIYSNLYIFKLFRPLIILAGCLLPYIGYILGGIIAIICRQSKKKVITIAIETGMQNVGIAMLLLIYAFPPPEGEIAAVAPIASAIMTPLPVFVLTIIYLIYKKCNPDKYKHVTSSDKDNTDDKTKNENIDYFKKDKNSNKLEIGEMTADVIKDLRETDI